MTKPHRALVAPSTVKETLAHRPTLRQRNADVRARKNFWHD